jgi:TonB family protein
VLLPLIVAALTMIPRSQDPATQQLCGTVIEIACSARQPALMTLLVEPGVSAKIFAPTPRDAAGIRDAVSVKREQRVCLSGVLGQKQSVTSPANFVVRAATDITPQDSSPGDWPTADVYTQCDPGVQAVNVKTFPRPLYTQDAMKAQIQGAAIVQAIIGVNGQVERTRLVKSLDAEHGLDEEALKAAQQWTFTPATKDGTPVRMQVTLELTFTLRK